MWIRSRQAGFGRCESPPEDFRRCPGEDGDGFRRFPSAISQPRRFSPSDGPRGHNRGGTSAPNPMDRAGIVARGTGMAGGATGKVGRPRKARVVKRRNTRPGWWSGWVLLCLLSKVKTEGEEVCFKKYSLPERRGGMYYFDAGSGSSPVCGDPLNMRQLENFTVSTLFYPLVTDRLQYLLSRSDDMYNIDFVFEILPGGFLGAQLTLSDANVADQAGVFTTSNRQVQANLWYHVTWVYNRTHLTTYVNGDVDAVEIVNSCIECKVHWRNGSRIKIGGGPSAIMADFEGMMDTLALWDRSLTLPEVIALHQGALVESYSNGLLANYDSSNNFFQLLDVSGNDNHCHFEAPGVRVLSPLTVLEDGGNERRSVVAHRAVPWFPENAAPGGTSRPPVLPFSTSNLDLTVERIAYEFGIDPLEVGVYMTDVQSRSKGDDIEVFVSAGSFEEGGGLVHLRLRDGQVNDVQFIRSPFLNVPCNVTRWSAFPTNLALSAVDHIVFVTFFFGHCVCKLDLSEMKLSLLAGSGGVGYQDGIGANALFNGPAGIAVSGNGSTLYVADSGNHVIRRISLSTLEVGLVAGRPGFGGFSDGNVEDSLFTNPEDLLVSRYPIVEGQEERDRLYVVDTGNARIRIVGPDFAVGSTKVQVSTLIGNDGGGTTLSNTSIYSAAVRLTSPSGAGSNEQGNMLYIVDSMQNQVMQLNITDTSSFWATPVVGSPGIQTRSSSTKCYFPTGMTIQNPTRVAVNMAQGRLHLFTLDEDARTLSLTTDAVLTCPGTSISTGGIIAIVVAVVFVMFLLAGAFYWYKSYKALRLLRREREKEERLTQIQAVYLKSIAAMSMAHGRDSFEVAKLDQHGGVALVFTDIQASSSLAGFPEAYREIQQTHDRLIREILASYPDGIEFGSEGDAFQLAFHTAPSALLFCFEAQERLLHNSWSQEVLNCHWSTSTEFSPDGELIFAGPRVRMGCHWCVMGTFSHSWDSSTHHLQFHGQGVVCAKDVGDVGHGGQVLLTGEFMQEVHRDLSKCGYPWVTDLGCYQLPKYQKEAVRIFSASPSIGSSLSAREFKELRYANKVEEQCNLLSKNESRKDRCCLAVRFEGFAQKDDLPASHRVAVERTLKSLTQLFDGEYVLSAGLPEVYTFPSSTAACRFAMLLQVLLFSTHWPDCNMEGKAEPTSRGPSTSPLADIFTSEGKLVHTGPRACVVVHMPYGGESEREGWLHCQQYCNLGYGGQTLVTEPVWTCLAAHLSSLHAQPQRLGRLPFPGCSGGMSLYQMVPRQLQERVFPPIPLILQSGLETSIYEAPDADQDMVLVFTSCSPSQYLEGTRSRQRGCDWNSTSLFTANPVANPSSVSGGKGDGETHGYSVEKNHDELLHEARRLGCCNKGYEVKHLAPGQLLFAFHRVDRALSWARGLQHWCSGGTILRIGICCGRPLYRAPNPVTGRMDYFGNMANVASRLTRDVCAAGAVCLSWETTSKTAPKEHLRKCMSEVLLLRGSGVTLKSLGYHRLEGVALEQLAFEASA